MTGIGRVELLEPVGDRRRPALPLESEGRGEYPQDATWQIRACRPHGTFELFGVAQRVGSVTGQRLARHGRQGVEIGPSVDVGGADGLLRRHVGGGTDRHTSSRDGLSTTRRPGNAEVGDQPPAGGPFAQDVGGLDVAMDDPTVMREGQARADLAQQFPHLSELEPPMLLEVCRQRNTVHERHDEEGELVLDVELVDRNDVRMREVGRQLRLAPKPSQFVAAFRSRDGKHLDGDL